MLDNQIAILRTQLLVLKKLDIYKLSIGELVESTQPLLVEHIVKGHGANTKVLASPFKQISSRNNKDSVALKDDVDKVIKQNNFISEYLLHLGNKPEKALKPGESSLTPITNAYRFTIDENLPSKSPTASTKKILQQIEEQQTKLKVSKKTVNHLQIPNTYLSSNNKITGHIKKQILLSQIEIQLSKMGVLIKNINTLDQNSQKESKIPYKKYQKKTPNIQEIS